MDSQKPVQKGSGFIPSSGFRAAILWWIGCFRLNVVGKTARGGSGPGSRSAMLQVHPTPAGYQVPHGPAVAAKALLGAWAAF